MSGQAAAPDQVIRLTVNWWTARRLDQIGEARGLRRSDVVERIVAGALEANAVEELLDLAATDPDPSTRPAPGGVSP